MPRKRNAVKNETSRSRPRRSTRQKAPGDDEIPEVYTEMLVEAYRNDPDTFAADPRPAKRRKIDEPVPLSKRDPSSLLSPKERDIHSDNSIQRQQQIVFQNDFDDSDDSDAEFEDVEIDRGQAQEGTSDAEQTDPEPLQIDMTPHIKVERRTIIRRKPVTNSERALRLDIHKWHVLSLIMHVAIRNQWCDNTVVQQTLKPLISRKIISQLHLDESETQAKRKICFDHAIEQVCRIWIANWKTEGRGLKRAFWRDHLDLEKELEESSDPVDLDDFKEAATNCIGSRDVGAQLFCALLRSVAVETRLVCSFQVLPFSRVAKGETPQKPPTVYIQAGKQNFGSSRSRISGSSRDGNEISESPYPIFWVEVLNPAIMQWIPLDPIVRQTINKPRTGFEPPAADNLNAMSYVIAFEDDGTAKDVTRRYTTAYNAKIRKSRVEVTHHGEKWWERVMSFFEKVLSEPRDDIEEAALNRQVAVEGMPKSVQDFKDHPVYVLERQLRANEVIHPKREAGKFAAGSGKSQKVESVYRRQDVHLCRSANAWYRKGRDVRAGEVPLKRVVSRSGKNDDLHFEGNENDSAQVQDTPLYAEYQTEIYIPPSVVDDLVPRNGFGNLDVYVKSMIPAGAVHFRHPLAVQAAKALKIDFAEAVTGFSFKGRQGTAVIDGIVISERYVAALSTLTTEFQLDLQEQVQTQRRAVLLAAWKKMLTVLRIRQRVQDEYGGRAKTTSNDSNDDDDPTYRDDHDGGGFMPGGTSLEADGNDQEDPALNALKEKQPIVLPPVSAFTRIVVVRSLHEIPESSLVKEGATHKQQSDTNQTHQSAQTDPELAGGFFVETNDVPFNHGHGAQMLESRHCVTNFGHNQSELSDHDGPSADADEQGGGFMVEDVEEVETGELHKNGESSSSKEELFETGLKSRIDAFDDTDGRSGKQRAEVDVTVNQQCDVDTEADEHDDTRSRVSDLSHDPEEDDLEPEWLNDAFED